MPVPAYQKQMRLAEVAGDLVGLLLEGLLLAERLRVSLQRKRQGDVPAGVVDEQQLWKGTGPGSASVLWVSVELCTSPHESLASQGCKIPCCNDYRSLGGNGGGNACT